MSLGVKIRPKKINSRNKYRMRDRIKRLTENDRKWVGVYWEA